MNNFLLFIGALLVMVLGIAFAAPQYVDWDEYRGAFEEEASRVLGRPIRVGGRVDLRLLPTPYVRFERFRIADQNGHFGRPLFKADVLKLWVSVAPLLRGVIEAKQIEISRPRLRLVFDENGQGNWRGLGRNSEGLSGFGAGLLPGKVALQDVKINSGLITIFGPGDRQLFKATSLNGELSARSLTGPFQFKGNLRYGGRRRDIRLASRRMLEDGIVPFKAVLSDDKGGARYTFNGSARDIGTSPKLSGQLLAKLPLSMATISPNRPQKPGPEVGTRLGKSEPVKSKSPSSTFDLKSKLSAQATGLKLSNLSLSFVHAGRPQLLTGEVVTTWEKEFSTSAQFTARWLDLDKIAGISAQDSPMLIMGAFVGQLDQMLGEAVISRASLKIDQANLGGGVVSNIFLDLTKRDDILDIKALRAEMPGRSILNAQGRVEGLRQARTFTGDLLLRGSNLKQYLGWMAKGSNFPADAQGRFGLNAKLNAGPGWIKTSAIVGEVANMSVFGSVQYDWRGIPALELDLQTPRLDATRLLPGGLRLGDMARLLGGRTLNTLGPIKGANKRTQTAVSVDKASADPSPISRSIKLRIGRLITSQRSYADVELDTSLKGDVYTISRLNLSSGDELIVDLKGRIAAFRAAPKGVVRGTVTATTDAAVRDLAQLFQLPGMFTPGENRSRFIAPLRLAGSAQIGRRQAGSVDLILAGAVQGAQTDLVLRLDRGIKDWRRALVDLSLDMNTTNLPVLMAQLFPAAGAYTALKGKPGRFMFNAVGVPGDGLASIVTLKGEGVDARFDGAIKLASVDRPLALGAVKGKVSLDVQNLAPMLSLLALDRNLLGKNTPASGSFALSSSAQATTMNDIQLVIASSGVTGSASILTKATQAKLSQADQTVNQPQRRKIVADLVVNKLTTAAMLTPILAAAPDGVDETIAGATYVIAGGPSSIWPEAPFSFKALRQLDGDIKLKSAYFAVGPDLQLTNASLRIALSEGRAVVKSFAGDTLGGRLSGSLEFVQAPAGAKVKGTLKLARADISKLFMRSGAQTDQGSAKAVQTGLEGAAATGRAGLALSFSGQALSARGLMAVMRGSGVATLASARLARMNPLAVSAAADAVLDRKPKDVTRAMLDELTAGFASGDLPLGPRLIKLTISDGALRGDDFTIDTPQGTVTASNSVDLAGLTFSSSWSIAAKPQRSEITGRMMSALPAVTLSFSGELGQIGALEPRIDAAALVRELTVREMERDVERLENIRKSDEERAQRDAVRRRALKALRERKRQQEEAARYRALQAQPLPGLSDTEIDDPGVFSAPSGSPLNPPDPNAPSSEAAQSNIGDGGTSGANQTALTAPVPRPVPHRKRKRSRKPKPQSFWDLFN